MSLIGHALDQVGREGRPNPGAGIQRAKLQSLDVCLGLCRRVHSSLRLRLDRCSRRGSSREVVTRARDRTAAALTTRDESGGRSR